METHTEENQDLQIEVTAPLFWAVRALTPATTPDEIIWNGLGLLASTWAEGQSDNFIALRDQQLACGRRLAIAMVFSPDDLRAKIMTLEELLELASEKDAPRELMVDIQRLLAKHYGAGHSPALGSELPQA
ncbi:MAG: hypothetical protein IT380_09900 [Myxococcales bacterium]|nr:hypothetical protein [Myxococcales bacterium]